MNESVEVTAWKPSLLDRLRMKVGSIRIRERLTGLTFKLFMWLSKERAGNLVKHAKRELELIGMFDERDFYGGMTGNAVMELITVFSWQGHSGMSAGLVRGLFDKAADFRPLSPLTGEESEWGTCADKDQNNRCSRVFRDEDGTAYDIYGRVFVEPDRCVYTSQDSLVPVTFPYEPHTERVNVAKS